MTRKVDPEEFLKRFALRPPPPGLRDRISSVPEKRKAPAAFWTPLQWKAVSAFFILGLSAVLLDLGLARLQKDRLVGLLNLPSFFLRENGSRDELLAEVWSSRADSAWIKERLKLEKKPARKEDRRELFLYLKEEFDGS